MYTTQAINLTGKMQALIKLVNFILTTKSPGVKFSGSTNPITGKKYVWKKQPMKNKPIWLQGVKRVQIALQSIGSRILTKVTKKNKRNIAVLSPKMKIKFEHSFYAQDWPCSVHYFNHNICHCQTSFFAPFWALKLRVWLICEWILSAGVYSTLI